MHGNSEGGRAKPAPGEAGTTAAADDTLAVGVARVGCAGDEADVGCDAAEICSGNTIPGEVMVGELTTDDDFEDSVADEHVKQTRASTES
jgi:hypothetical protein